jgi:hypothetical protein
MDIQLPRRGQSIDRSRLIDWIDGASRHVRRRRRSTDWTYDHHTDQIDQPTHTQASHLSRPQQQPAVVAVRAAVCRAVSLNERGVGICLFAFEDICIRAGVSSDRGKPHRHPDTAPSAKRLHMDVAATVMGRVIKNGMEKRMPVHGGRCLSILTGVLSLVL